MVVIYPQNPFLFTFRQFVDLCRRRRFVSTRRRTCLTRSRTRSNANIANTSNVRSATCFSTRTSTTATRWNTACVCCRHEWPIWRPWSVRL